jgi:hypothetical protein
MNDRPTATLVPWILWGAFVFSHLVFVVIGQVARDPGAALSPEELQPILITMSGVAIGVVAFSLGMAPRIFAKAPYFTFLILRFAFAESVTIFGLVLAFMGADWRVPVTFAAFGLLLHALAAPTEADRRRHESGPR